MNLRVVFERGIPLALLALLAVSEVAVAHGGAAHAHGSGVPWLEIAGIALVGIIVLRLVMRNVAAPPGDGDLEDDSQA